MTKALFILVVFLLTSCQQGPNPSSTQINGNFRYNESPVQPITSPLVVRYRPFPDASSVKDEVTVAFAKNGSTKTTNERTEGTVNLTELGENLLYHADIKTGGVDFAINMLMKESGEIIEASLSGPDTEDVNKVKEAFGSLLSTFKAFSAIYPSDGIKSGDNIFAGRGDVQMGSYDARINLTGTVEGLVQSRGRPSILVDLAGSYMVVESNPKVYLEGWMLLDISNGITTRSHMRMVMQLPKSPAVEKIILTSTQEIKLPRLTTEQTADPSEKQFYLDLAWENLLQKREVFPVMIRQVGRVGYVKSASLIGGKKCDAVFRYDETGQGDWEVACTDGTRAVGVLQTLGRGKGSRGSGFDTDGNKIDFRIRHSLVEN